MECEGGIGTLFLEEEFWRGTVDGDSAARVGGKCGHVIMYISQVTRIVARSDMFTREEEFLLV